MKKNIVEVNLERMENGLPPLEGWEEWAKHQKACSEEHCKALDKALGIIRDEDGVGCYLDKEIV